MCFSDVYSYTHTHTQSCSLWMGVVQIPLDGCEQETLAPSANTDKSGEEWRVKKRRIFFISYFLSIMYTLTHKHSQMPTNKQIFLKFTVDNTENHLSLSFTVKVSSIH